MYYNIKNAVNNKDQAYSPVRLDADSVHALLTPCVMSASSAAFHLSAAAALLSLADLPDSLLLLVLSALCSLHHARIANLRGAAADEPPCISV